MATKPQNRDEAFRPFDLTRDDERAAEAAVRRFLFSIDFDAPEPKVSSAEREREIDDQVEEVDSTPPAPPPLFTEDDLETAREEARVLGHAQGLKDAEESALHFQVLALESIAEQMSGLRAAQDAANAETHRLAAALAVAIVRKLMPAMVRDHGVDEIENLIAACVPHILNEPRLIIRVAPENADAIRERAEALARERGFDGAIVVMTDVVLGLADSRLEWENGGAERDLDALFQSVEAIVKRNSERAPETGGDADAAHAADAE